MNKHTHTHTHREHTPRAVGSRCCPGSSWGFSALLKGLTSVVVLKVKRALDIHSPDLQSLTNLRLEPETFVLQVDISPLLCKALWVPRKALYKCYQLLLLMVVIVPQWENYSCNLKDVVMQRTLCQSNWKWFIWPTKTVFVFTVNGFEKWSITKWILVI